MRRLISLETCCGSWLAGDLLADLEGLKVIPGVTGAISGKALLDGALSLEDAAVRAAVSCEGGA